MRVPLTPAQIETLRTAYRQAIHDSDDGRLPPGWIARQAEAMHLSYQTVYGRVTLLKREPRETAVDESEPKPRELAHSKPPADRTRVASGLVANGHAQPREHGHSHNCWCRRSPSSVKNPWCAIKAPSRPPAALTDPRPRVERYQRRYGS